MRRGLDHIDNWIFDLDNCLYPAACDLFSLVDERMGAYIQRLVGCDLVEARRIQKQHFHDHGTTLAGLMASHGIDPHDFLSFVHDIDFGRIDPNPSLVDAIARLPGRKFVFTNGDADYASQILDRIGLAGAFDGLHDIHAMDYVPKPNPAAYARLCDRLGIDARRAFFAEDMARNLKPAKALGMTTLWVDNGSEQAGHDGGYDFIDFRTGDIAAWLTDLLGDQDND